MRSTPSSQVPHTPKYRHHKASGQAVATFGGKDFYLGTYGTKASKIDYDRRLAEWISAGRPTYTVAGPGEILVMELLKAYWEHVKSKSKGKTHSTIKPTIRRLNRLYGKTLAVKFGPKSLKAFRLTLIAERIAPKAESESENPSEPRRHSRRYVNRMVDTVKRMFKWAVSEELLPVAVYTALQTVGGLMADEGEDPPPDRARITPVDDKVIDATLPHLSPLLADMVRLQRLTGMRPGEVCRMTVAEIDMSGPIWHYKPVKHKNAHRGKERIIAIGPSAQSILHPYLRTTELTRPIFSPEKAWKECKDKRREETLAATSLIVNRQTGSVYTHKHNEKHTPSRIERDKERAANPRRKFSERYTSNVYAKAIRRACEAAGVPCWAPNRVRHTCLTVISHNRGIEAARVIGGHSKVETTQIYAESNLKLADQIALAMG